MERTVYELCQLEKYDVNEDDVDAKTSERGGIKSRENGGYTVTIEDNFDNVNEVDLDICGNTLCVNERERN
jgi:hypothetical protein